MNNVNHECPPKMSDARHVTDYRPSCFVHLQIMKQNGLVNSHQQRLFFQRNAEQLHDLSLKHFAAKSGCPQPYVHVDPNGHDAYWKNYKAALKI
jgi:hypothetical protein